MWHCFYFLNPYKLQQPTFVPALSLCVLPHLSPCPSNDCGGDGGGLRPRRTPISLAGHCGPPLAIKLRRIDVAGHKNVSPSGVSALAWRKTPRHPRSDDLLPRRSPRAASRNVSPRRSSRRRRENGTTRREGEMGRRDGKTRREDETGRRDGKTRRDDETGRRDGKTRRDDGYRTLKAGAYTMPSRGIEGCETRDETVERRDEERGEIRDRPSGGRGEAIRDSATTEATSIRDEWRRLETRWPAPDKATAPDGQKET